MRKAKYEEHMNLIKQKQKYNNLEIKARNQEMNDKFHSID